MKKYYKYRDISVLNSDMNQCFIVASDTSSSIGLKEFDILKISPNITAAYCVRVTLFEILSAGGNPLLVIINNGNEWNPTGEKFIQGIKKELLIAGYEDLPINGSSENNMETKMTSLGVTLIGQSSIRNLKIKNIEYGDSLFHCCIPLVGEELLKPGVQLPSYQDLLFLIKHEKIKEVVPIGSKGALNEAKQLAEANCKLFKKAKLSKKQYKLALKSAGPVTSILVSGENAVENELRERFNYVCKIGTIQ